MRVCGCSARTHWKTGPAWSWVSSPSTPQQSLLNLILCFKGLPGPYGQLQMVVFETIFTPTLLLPQKTSKPIIHALLHAVPRKCWTFDVHTAFPLVTCTWGQAVWTLLQWDARPAWQGCFIGHLLSFRVFTLSTGHLCNSGVGRESGDSCYSPSPQRHTCKAMEKLCTINTMWLFNDMLCNR